MQKGKTPTRNVVIVTILLVLTLYAVSTMFYGDWFNLSKYEDIQSR